ncbi:MAG: response regulator transcription factor [Bdellovibrionaceae bacterium]|nr:response regulator transcription factor [Pseudobdellovibrionaceae bacterium]
MIRAILVDDEMPAIDRLKKLLKSFNDLDVVGEAYDGLSALSLIEEKKPDIVFLDIEMPELNGLEVAKTLGVQGPPIIFVTAYDEHALKAFESSAIDYLVKPINTTRLEFAIEKIRKSLSKEKDGSLETLLSKLQGNGNPTRLAVKIGTKYEVFDPSLISVAISKDHYTSLIVDGRELLCDDSLEAIIARLDPTIFIRVHRGAALNIRFLKELKREGDRKFTAILNDKGQSQVQVSRERLPRLKKFLGLE